MATAFSYSGTGLQSEIQSGSGGITSTDTVVEVDSIPSDLSAGDTIKVALGTATQWANGNGETVHGEIGTVGGAANGGTEITGLSRGQEGTSASSWSEGDPVRVGVQGRDNVLIRGLVHAHLLADMSEGRILRADDFATGATSGQSLDGRVSPTGHVWSTVVGSFELHNGMCVGTGAGRSIATLGPPITGVVHTTTKSVIAQDDGEIAGHLLEFSDADNCRFYRKNSDSQEQVLVSSGSDTVEGSNSLGSSGRSGYSTDISYGSDGPGGYTHSSVKRFGDLEVFEFATYDFQAGVVCQGGGIDSIVVVDGSIQ